MLQIASSFKEVDGQYLIYLVKVYDTFVERIKILLIYSWQEKHAFKWSYVFGLWACSMGWVNLSKIILRLILRQTKRSL